MTYSPPLNLMADSCAHVAGAACTQCVGNRVGSNDAALQTQGSLLWLLILITEVQTKRWEAIVVALSPIVERHTQLG